MPIAPDFEIRTNAEDVSRRFSNIRARAAPYAIARGLTMTARAILNQNRRNMQRVFDRPTKFTLNAFETIEATKTRHVAIVRFKLFGQTSSGFGSEAYLAPQEFGGGRRAKRFELRLRRRGILGANEFAVPARGARLDRYGNFPGSTLTQILSQLQAFNTAGFNANQTEQGRKRRIKLGKTQFFGVRTGASAFLPGGVYRRTGRKTGKKGQPIVPRGAKAELIFVKQPFYRPRLRFYDTAKLVYRNRIAKNIEESFSVMIKRFAQNH